MSKYCADLMPLLLDYLSSLSQAKIGHVTKAFYALENFMENLGKFIYAVFNWRVCSQKLKKQKKVYLADKKTYFFLFVSLNNF